MPAVEDTQSSNTSATNVTEEHADQVLATEGVATVSMPGEEAKGRKPLGIQAPGLLTVLHFVLGIKQQWSGEVTDDRRHDTSGFDKKNAETDHPMHRCSCPNCPGKTRSMKQNMTEAFKANQSELNKDVTKNSVGKLPCRCAAESSPAKHGTEHSLGSDGGGTPPKVCRLPGVTSYQMVAPLWSDVGRGFYTMAKAITVWEVSSKCQWGFCDHRAIVCWLFLIAKSSADLQVTLSLWYPTTPQNPENTIL